MSNLLDKRLLFTTGENTGLQFHDIDAGEYLGKIELGINFSLSYRCQFIPPNLVVSGASTKIFVFDIEKKIVSKEIQTGFINPYGFDVITSQGKHIIIMGNTRGDICAYDLETSEEIYYSKKTFNLEAREILKKEDNERLFCAAGEKSIQIHDLEKKKKILSGDYNGFEEGVHGEGYIVGFAESKIHSLYAAGMYYEKFVMFVDNRTLKCVGKSKKRESIHAIGKPWSLEEINGKILVGLDTGMINVYDLRKYEDPAYSFQGLERKINKILKIGDGESICVTGDCEVVKMHESVSKFSENDEKKLMKEFKIQKNEMYYTAANWGLCTNFVVKSKNLEMSKKDNKERVEYIFDEYLEDKKYSRKVVLRNTTLSCFSILL